MQSNKELVGKLLRQSITNFLSQNPDFDSIQSFILKERPLTFTVENASILLNQIHEKDLSKYVNDKYSNLLKKQAEIDLKNIKLHQTRRVKLEKAIHYLETELDCYENNKPLPQQPIRGTSELPITAIKLVEMIRHKEQLLANNAMEIITLKVDRLENPPTKVHTLYHQTYGHRFATGELGTIGSGWHIQSSGYSRLPGPSQRERDLEEQQERLYDLIPKAKRLINYYQKDLKSLNKEIQRIEHRKDLRRIQKYATGVRQKLSTNKSTDIKRNLSNKLCQDLYKAIDNKEKELEFKKKAILNLVKKHSFKAFYQYMNGDLSQFPFHEDLLEKIIALRIHSNKYYELLNTEKILNQKRFDLFSQLSKHLNQSLQGVVNKTLGQEHHQVPKVSKELIKEILLTNHAIIDVKTRALDSLQTARSIGWNKQTIRSHPVEPNQFDTHEANMQNRQQLINRLIQYLNRIYSYERGFNQQLRFFIATTSQAYNRRVNYSLAQSLLIELLKGESITTLFSAEHLANKRNQLFAGINFWQDFNRGINSEELNNIINDARLCCSTLRPVFIRQI